MNEIELTEEEQRELIADSLADEFLECDCCKKAIDDFDFDLFHLTGVLDGELNKHIHLCLVCFEKTGHTIPIIKTEKE